MRFRLRTLTAVGALLLLTACQPLKWPPVRISRPQPPPPGADVPKAAAPAPELVTGPLEVPDRFKTGPFATPHTLVRPRGFRVSVFAAGLGPARFMAFGPGGELLVTVPRQGKVLALPDRDGDGVADEIAVLAENLDRPHGIAVRVKDLIVAEMTRVLRFPGGAAAAGQRPVGKLGEPKVLISDLPAGGNHWTRTVVFGQDGRMYVSIGSSCNACVEKDERRATVMVFNEDGAGGRIFARGLRNSVGLALHPRTGELWATDNGRDLLGDDLPPEEVNILRDGGDYGWPRCYGDRVPDPGHGKPEECARTIPPAVRMQAHSAPLGLAFASAAASPDFLRGDLFVALHGSWNRSERTGYRVVRIPVKPDAAGNPAPGAAEDFVAGWLREGQVWGRPVDVAFGPKGDMFVSDDYSGAIYRVWWQR